MKIKKIFVCFLVAGFVMIKTDWTVCAGQITFDLGQKVTDLGVHISRVGNIVDGEYVFEAPYDKADIDTEKLETAANMKDAAEKLSRISGDVKTAYVKENDTCVFENLESGVYLVTVDETSAYGEVDPFLVSLPMYIDGEMQYTIVSDVKFRKKGKPKTGDSENIMLYGTVCIATAFVVHAVKEKK